VFSFSKFIEQHARTAIMGKMSLQFDLKTRKCASPAEFIVFWLWLRANVIVSRMSTSKTHSFKSCCVDYPNQQITRSEDTRTIATQTDEPSYLCRICCRSFATLKGLRIHTSRAHSPHIFACELCNKKYRDQRRLAQHKQNSHGIDSHDSAL
jgi:hypothetical protein